MFILWHDSQGYASGGTTGTQILDSHRLSCYPELEELDILKQSIQGNLP